MTDADIERMAREAGCLPPYGTKYWVATAADLARFAALFAAAERERCAVQLDALGCDHCAATIRAGVKP